MPFKTDKEFPDDKDTITKAKDEQDASKQFKGAPPKSKKWCFGKCNDDLKDLVLISKAVPIIPSATMRLSETGVPHSYYSLRVGSEGQSIYKCLLRKPETEINCTYCAAQLAAMTTHIRRKHMKVCVKCRLCDKWAFSITTISLHLKTVHHDAKAEWFEPTPPLEGNTEEVTKQILAANLQEVESVKTEWDEEQDE